MFGIIKSSIKIKHFKKLIDKLIDISKRGLVKIKKKSKYNIDQCCITSSKLHIFVERRMKRKKVIMKEWGILIRC